jgi:hypothetical protein
LKIVKIGVMDEKCGKYFASISDPSEEFSVLKLTRERMFVLEKRRMKAVGGAR